MPRRQTPPRPAAAPRVAPPPASSPPDPLPILRSRSYMVLLVFGAIVGVIVAAVAYFYLKLVAEAQQYVFVTLPKDLGFHAAPVWWPAPLLALSGLLVGLTIRYLPGTGGHKPAEGFKFSGPGRRARAAGHRHRLLCHPEPGRRARARGAPDRHRRRARRPGHPPAASATRLRRPWR